jgi:hypothetical protein
MLYGAGLRFGEYLELGVKDLDFDQHQRPGFAATCGGGRRRGFVCTSRRCNGRCMERRGGPASASR